LKEGEIPRPFGDGATLMVNFLSIPALTAALQESCDPEMR
jgi:hypothetical protein